MGRMDRGERRGGGGGLLHIPKGSDWMSDSRRPHRMQNGIQPRMHRDETTTDQQASSLLATLKGGHSPVVQESDPFHEGSPGARHVDGRGGDLDSLMPSLRNRHPR
eukprot:NODE_665_length_817_cov_932.299479_g505_i0.p2 GENE.NODE_665_length_817_cov_932.299479_g505_i0~~NODE_665_length_817_cov_932.299479_g505_i0.p2  ORF type:complete len:117 (+),score=30.10 NODE_665_length_817_cov_932.299479_g505_i0:35-352(+)